MMWDRLWQAALVGFAASLGGSLEASNSGVCPGDLTGDCVVDGTDLALVLGYWGSTPPLADLNGDLVVDGIDLSIVLGNWGNCGCDYDYSLYFDLDPGIRVEGAANAQASVDDEGQVWLYYMDGNPGEPRKLKRASSADGLTFPRGIEPTDWLWHAKNIRLPEGFDAAWRKVWWDMALQVFRASASDDGAFFVPQEDPCYEARPEDTLDIGITDCFVMQDGRVVLLYIGDMFGLNNVRRAESLDGGVSFTFVDDDVFGDADKGGTVNSFVDQRVVYLGADRYRAFVMRDGKIYSFTSNDGGESFDTFDEELIAPDDIPDLAVRSLHDPSVIQLSDGRWRMYFTAFIDNDPPGPGGDDYEVILSATTDFPNFP